MSQKRGASVADLIQKLSEAKVINTDVTLKASLGAISSMAEVDPIDFWCGTIRRPWVVIRPHVDVEETLVDMAKTFVAMKQQMGATHAGG
jgi:hypothetical protein